MKNLIIFDMDGVLVDVSASYRETVRKTAYLFLKDSIGGGQLKEPLFSLKELSTIKQSGGLNNDWDLSHRVITLLMSMVLHYGSPEREMWDLAPLAEILLKKENPLEELMRAEKDYTSSQADWYYRNDVGSGNLIKQIFQEVYLGPELFTSTYGMDPGFYKGEGYILREKLYISPEKISGWAEDNIIAIATGRPRAEALYPIRKNNLDFFAEIFSLDECLDAEKKEAEKSGRYISFSKPHPFMLDSIADKVMERGEEIGEYYYVGDMPDDMIAASESDHGFKGVAVLYSAPDKQESLNRLKEAGASVIAETADELDVLFR